MIDLSHLTEEEQEAIMTVLRRDADLKRAEEERVRKLEKVLPSASRPGVKLKYLTGEWFYEAKSRRHDDKIHGSEIILAAMKQEKAASSDGSPRTDRSKTPGGQRSDVVAPPKPARCFELEKNKAEKENRFSGVSSLRMPRHNPFNRASLADVDAPENKPDLSIHQDQDLQETEPVPSLKSHPAGDSSQTSGGSITSGGSSTGFRPVPKKRTLLLSRSQLRHDDGDDSQWGLDAQLSPTEVVPAPRRQRRHPQQGSGSNPSCPESKGEAQREGALNLPVHEEAPPQVSSSLSLEREGNVARSTPRSTPAFIPNTEVGSLPSPARVFSASRAAPITRTDGSAGRETAKWEKDGDDPTQRGRATSDLFGGREEPSLTRSAAEPDPPVSYDLTFIDKPAQQKQKSNPTDVFQLSTQSASPTGEDEDAIAKVLDWFSRSTDSNDWLDADDEPRRAAGSDEQRSAARRAGGEGQLDGGEGKVGAPESGRRPGKGGKTREDADKDARERMPLQDVSDAAEENQPVTISHLKSFWEKSNSSPRIVFSKPLTSADRGPNADISSVPESYGVKGIQEKYGSGLQLNHQQQEETLTFNSNQRNDNHPRPSERSVIESDGVSGVKPKLPPQSDQTPRRDLPSSSRPVTDPQSWVRLDSEELLLSRSDSYGDCEQDESNEPAAAEAQSHGGPGEDVQQRDGGAKDRRPSLSPKRRAGVAHQERTSVPQVSRQASRQQESTAERIKQLRSFWDQERNKPSIYTGRPKGPGNGKAARGAGQARLNKRFTKSEFDLTSVGNESGSDEDGGNSFAVLPPSRRLDKPSPSLGTSRAQFNTLREFWDEATADPRGLLTSGKQKTSRRTEAPRAQLLPQSAEPEVYPLSPTTEKTKGAVTKSCLSPQSRTKSPRDRGTGSGSKVQDSLPSYVPAEMGQQKRSRRSSKDHKEKSSKAQNGREVPSPKSRKDSFSFSSSRGNSLRRATSMFTLSTDGENTGPDQLRTEAEPVQTLGRKPRQSTGKGPLSRGSSDESGTPAPRARAFVPTDYRHYLGTTDDHGVHEAPGPVLGDDGPDGLDPGGPLSASTPTSSEDRPGRRPNKTSQRPAWPTYSESDTGHESSMSSTSETWSRNSSNRTNDDDLNPVRKALWRAEAWPKNLAKSLEDITAPPRQERRPEQSADLRRSSNVSASSSFSDPEHLKKMSRSVPSFLQEEDGGGPTAGGSMTTLSGSSGAASLSGSVMTVYGGDFVEVQGSVHFSINYVQKLREFHIFVAECRDLAAVDPKRNRSDPYVKSYLVPDKANLGKRKTSVKKKTLNPKFNEILRYRVRMEYLRTQTLVLSVWHHDTFGRNSFLGEVDMDLSKWDSDHTQMNRLALRAKTVPFIAPLNAGRGEMRLAVRFLPQVTHSEGLRKDVSSTGEIHVWVKECKNLPLIRATIDPYVKCFVLPDTSRKSRQKTRVLRRTADPVFNHTMVYDGISEPDLADVCVELTVWDRDRLASSLLGGLRLGAGTGRSYGALVDWMDSGPYEAALWDRMIASPNQWVEDVLPLRMLLSARTAFR
ncbi:synaptotagmin-like protein 2 isoform X2 [Kryptolebias marmoratus]|uniref:synaptotagmin-like protein 2 isoform X2 n=1 Tax=Kryptolebias marmoratus TaxID=37003 RepID=UPI0018AD0C15|nr:synaptotagmin-like protein 2 isoform X2 [Kryptolebias marmoratus]